MRCTTDSARRNRYIAGLHALADYLARHPIIPVPPYGSDILLPADSDQDGGFFQVERIARLLGVPVTDETAGGGHYLATRAFGPASYTVFSIPVACAERYSAHMSYSDCVDPVTENNRTNTREASR
jgi:hypothetical protein